VIILWIVIPVMLVQAFRRMKTFFNNKRL
jgi:hypothetical protein